MDFHVILGPDLPCTGCLVSQVECLKLCQQPLHMNKPFVNVNLADGAFNPVYHILSLWYKLLASEGENNVELGFQSRGHVIDNLELYGRFSYYLAL